MISYEDDWILVADKPAGMAVHAAQGVDTRDLYTELRATRPGLALLHRLDREASGLVLFGKRPEANAVLQRQLEAHQLERTYRAILAGKLAAPRIVDRPVSSRALGRGAMRRPPPPDALPARSRFTPLGPAAGGTLVEVELETGRKHQIRVHAAAIGHPIVGDHRYGGPAAPRMMLHAVRLRFRHPEDGRDMVLDSPARF